MCLLFNKETGTVESNKKNPRKTGFKRGLFLVPQIWYHSYVCLWYRCAQYSCMYRFVLICWFTHSAFHKFHWNWVEFRFSVTFKCLMLWGFQLMMLSCVSGGIFFHLLECLMLWGCQPRILSCGLACFMSARSSHCTDKTRKSPRWRVFLMLCTLISFEWKVWSLWDLGCCNDIPC